MHAHKFPLIKGFASLGEAKAYTVERGIENYKCSIKDGVGEATPQGQNAYYVVTNGRKPGS